MHKLQGLHDLPHLLHLCEFLLTPYKVIKLQQLFETADEKEKSSLNDLSHPVINQ